MKSLKLKLAIGALLAASLVACGGQAHAATSDLVTDTYGNGRVYSLQTATIITKNSATQFTITYANGSMQAIADSAGAKFSALATWASAGNGWAALTNSSGQAVYVNVAAGTFASCAGGYFTVEPANVTYTDGTSCPQYTALKAAAN